MPVRALGACAGKHGGGERVPQGACLVPGSAQATQLLNTACAHAAAMDTDAHVSSVLLLWAVCAVRGSPCFF